MVIIGWLKFAVVGAVLVGGTWMFGAWEMWWFWVFTSLISFGAFLTGLQLALSRKENQKPVLSRSAVWALLSMGPFVVYALISWWRADVFMSAERSVLLYITGIAMGLEALIGMDSRQRHILFRLIFINLLAIGIYGVINHLRWHSSHVLWVPCYPQYAGRAMGAYFCPDHFAGIMEVLLCMALAAGISRGMDLWQRLVALAAIPLALTAIALTQSRGGLLTLPVIFIGIFIWGFSQWPCEVRRSLRVVAGASAFLAAVVLLGFGGSHIERLVSYGGHWGKSAVEKSTSGEVEQQESVAEFKLRLNGALQALSRTSRGRMYGGAWRAWQSAPWLGIGAGMHQNLWPHFAATADGNRESVTWPTQTNDYFHSYEVHSDWLQLLEEYGTVGFLLFLIPVGMVGTLLVRGLRQSGANVYQYRDLDDDDESFTLKLAALLALLAIGFHSFGDFNLQMPATVWVLAVLLAIGIGNNESQINATDLGQ